MSNITEAKRVLEQIARVLGAFEGAQVAVDALANLDALAAEKQRHADAAVQAAGIARAELAKVEGELVTGRAAVDVAKQQAAAEIEAAKQQAADIVAAAKAEAKKLADAAGAKAKAAEKRAEDAEARCAALQSEIAALDARVVAAREVIERGEQVRVALKGVL